MRCQIVNSCGPNAECKRATAQMLPPTAQGHSTRLRPDRVRHYGHAGAFVRSRLSPITRWPGSRSGRSALQATVCNQEIVEVSTKAANSSKLEARNAIETDEKLRLIALRMIGRSAAALRV